ncbi:hypothetical protein ACFL3I_09990 [Pseudomonadota bacterium]
MKQKVVAKIRKFAKNTFLGIRKMLLAPKRFVLKRLSKKILLYTDSRGDNIHNHRNYRHYGARLAAKYYVEANLCPVKWTTTLDFLDFVKNVDLSQFDFVILHTGVVDNSPRHQKVVLEKIYPSKKDIFDEVFGEENIREYLNSDLGCDYEGDKTINLYSMQMAKECLIPRLAEIPNLIFINTNEIVNGWNGNYWKDRPGNISITEDYSRLFSESLENVIDLLEWSATDVKKYTFDNMHPNKSGSDYIFESIEERMVIMENKKS